MTEEMFLKIVVVEIQQITNKVYQGEIPGGTVIEVKFKPKLTANNIEMLLFNWIFKFKISDDEYIYHESTTLFGCEGFKLDNYALNDERLDVLTQLAQIAMSHSRLLYMELNKQYDIIPLILFTQFIKPEIRLQLQAFMN